MDERTCGHEIIRPGCPGCAPLLMRRRTFLFGAFALGVAAAVPKIFVVSAPLSDRDLARETDRILRSHMRYFAREAAAGRVSSVMSFRFAMLNDEDGVIRDRLVEWRKVRDA